MEDFALAEEFVNDHMLVMLIVLGNYKKENVQAKALSLIRCIYQCHIFVSFGIFRAIKGIYVLYFISKICLIYYMLWLANINKWLFAHLINRLNVSEI